MLQGVDDAGPQIPGNLGDDLGTQVSANRIAAKWQRKPGFFQPPRPKVGPEVKARIPVRQLSFMDQETDVYLAAMHGVFDLVERNDDADTVRLVELKPEVGCRQLAGHRNSQAAESQTRIVRTLESWRRGVGRIRRPWMIRIRAARSSATDRRMHGSRPR